MSSSVGPRWGVRAARDILTRRSAFSAAIAAAPEEHVDDLHHEDAITGVLPYSDIPGPRQLPLIGNAWRFAPFIGQYKIHELDRVMLSLHRDYGRIVKVGGLVGHPDLLFVFDGDEIERVFRREETLPHRPSMPSLHYYKQVLNKDFFGETAGVIGVHGKLWDNFRGQVQHIMLRPATARSYVGPLDEIASDFMDRIHEMQDTNNELPGNFLNELYKWALESVARVALDTRLGCLEADLAPDSEAQRIINSINVFFWNVAEVELRMPLWRIYSTKAYRKYIGALEDFRLLCMKHISQAMERLPEAGAAGEQRAAEDISIVERILRQSGDPKVAAVLALDLLLVGVDTTSVAATSTIYQLTQNPEKQARLFAELKTVLPDIDTPLTTQRLDQLPYLRACIKETLRMYPVILGNGRSLTSEAIIGGYRVPKGTHVIFPHYVVSNLPEYFPEPAEFRPERWLKPGKCPHQDLQDQDQQQQQPRIHPFVSLPFGYGRRTCIGRRFAEAELQILLAKMFRRYRIEYHYGKLTYKVSPTYIPEQPLKFRLTERLQPKIP